MSAEEDRRLTAEEYLASERASGIKHEFHYGRMIAMAGARQGHLLIVANLMRHLGNRLDGSPCKALSNDIRVLVDPLGLYCYPDLVVVCGTPQLADDQLDTLLNPALILEVLSESTESYERGDKFRR